MKKTIAITGSIALTMLFTACQHKQLVISAEPANGSPGDIVRVKMENVHRLKDAKVTIGQETALIVSSSDSALAVMIPPLTPQAIKLNVIVGAQQASTDFQIDSPATVRLWFSMNGSTVRFLERQASNEEFVRDKSYGPDKLMYEITGNGGEVLAFGYLNNPAVLEAPRGDQKGLSKVEIKGEVKFSINAPAFTDMQKIRLSVINASTGYMPKLLGETAIGGTNK